MIHFQIAEGLPTGEIDCFREKLQSAAEKALVLTDSSPECEISIVMTGDEEIRALNHQYLGIDAPTDVLSFLSDEVDPETGQSYLGDILIAFPYVREQAKNASHELGDELQLLTVHGILHLLGYDHGEETDRIKMWEKQLEIMKALGCPDDVIPA